MDRIFYDRENFGKLISGIKIEEVTPHGALY